MQNGCWRPAGTPSDLPRIVVMVGLPGSGKSTYLRNLGAPAISSDALRLQLMDDAADQTIHRTVFAAMRYLLKQRLLLRRPVSYVDATHLTPRERRPYIAMAALYDCQVEALYFDVSLDVCKARNRLRSRMVPEDAMDLLASRLVPPRLSEGFHAVHLAKAVAPPPTELLVSE